MRLEDQIVVSLTDAPHMMINGPVTKIKNGTANGISLVLLRLVSCR